MNECCKDKSNFGKIVNSDKYNAEGRLIEKKMKCNVCGNTERWYCVDLDADSWIKVNYTKCDLCNKELHPLDAHMGKLKGKLITAHIDCWNEEIKE